MKKYGKLLETLETMHALLVKHDAAQQKITLGAIKAVEESDRDAIIKSLNSVAFWGGAGSVSDVVLFEIPWTPAFRRDVPDDDKLTRLELQLLDEMANLGIAQPNAMRRKRDIRWIASAHGLEI